MGLAGASGAALQPVGQDDRIHCVAGVDEGLGDVDRLFLKSGAEQKLLRRAPAGRVHEAERLAVGLKQRHARLHHRQLVRRR